LEEAMTDQKPSRNTAMNKSKEGVAGEGPEAATPPPTVSHSNEVQERKEGQERKQDEKQDSRTRSATDQPFLGTR
jgi:hypothetical protein